MDGFSLGGIELTISQRNDRSGTFEKMPCTEWHPLEEFLTFIDSNPQDHRKQVLLKSIFAWMQLPVIVFLQRWKNPYDLLASKEPQFSWIFMILLGFSQKAWIRKRGIGLYRTCTRITYGHENMRRTNRASLVRRSEEGLVQPPCRSVSRNAEG